VNTPQSKHKPQLILASGSPYRKQLLQRLTDDFSVRAPNIDETPRDGESIAALVERLSREKARAVGKELDNALVIASDQSAALEGYILHKPGNFDNALQQLMLCCGKTVVFHTGLCLLDTRNQSEIFEDVLTKVVFRNFTQEEASSYLEVDQPWDCCGGIRSDSKGILLCERIDNDDPSTLIGLPLIALAKMLQRSGYKLL